ncbi:hypothetical protein I8D64_16685 [Brachybacterium sp. MASK1Z-5]|uniref:HTH luxR-type domain-containing protein n=2 Tax=Brachybacterium halotolerans TaxID=2795215 RepID=A0ABS1BEM3_9MICO|nr:LuxR family transcriptional regulator [Brachybacterium halotolerans]MBK0333041.1 hypothetical protein [Brachybacterium halotolerans]
MVFVARPEALALLQRALRDPAGRTLTVSGPIGSGKSFLLDALRGSASLPSTIVRAGSAPSDWTLGGLSSVLAAIDGLLGTETLPVLDAHDPADLPALARGIASEIERRSITDFLVIVDDADLLDEPSRTVLEVVTLRCAPHGMRCALAIRPDAQGPDSGRRQTIGLPDLDLETMRRLAGDFAPEGADPAVLLLLATAAGGNPLALEGLIDASLPEALDGTSPLQVPLPADARLEEAHRALLGPLDEEQMMLVQVLSSAPATPETTLLACGDPGASAVALDDLIGSGLVTRTGGLVRLRSLSLRSSVYWGQTAHARQSLHEKLAATAAGDAPEWGQWHLSFVDPERAQPTVLLEGARALVDAADTRPALHLVERALSLSVGEAPEIARLLCELVESLLAHGEIELAERYLSFARERFAGSGMPAALTRSALLFAHVRGEALPVHLLRHSLADHAAGTETERIDLVAMGALLLLQRWELRGARELVGLAQDSGLRATPLLATTSRLADLYHRVLHGEGAPAGACERVMIADLERPGDQGIVRTVLAQALSIAESYAEARDVVDPSGRGGTSSPAPRALSRALDLTEIELRAGLPARARESFRSLAPFGSSTRMMQPLVLRAQVALLLSSGEIEEAETILSRLQRSLAPGGNPRLEAEVAVLMARAARMGGNLESAAQHFARVRAQAARFHAPHLLRFHEHYIQTLVELGRREEAAAVLEELTALSHDAPSPWARLAIANSRTLLSTGESADGEIQGVIETGHDTGHELQRGQFLLAYSQRLEELGRSTDSRSARDAGLLAIDQTGQSTADLAPAPMPRTTASADPLARLGEKERAVAELVGRGMRNRAIASELFVSVRTVELRLTRVYRTLGIRSRAQLVQILQATGTGAGVGAGAGAERVGSRSR